MSFSHCDTLQRIERHVRFSDLYARSEASDGVVKIGCHQQPTFQLSGLKTNHLAFISDELTALITMLQHDKQLEIQIFNDIAQTLAHLLLLSI
jgi:hypothetical protein